MYILILQVFKFNMNGIKWIYNKFVYRCLQIKVTAGLTKLRLLAVHVIVKLQFHEDSVLIIIAVSNHWLQIWILWLNATTFVRHHPGLYISSETVSISHNSIILQTFWFWQSINIDMLLLVNFVHKIWQILSAIMYILMSKLDCYLPPKVQAIVKMALNVVETGKWHSY